MRVCFAKSQHNRDFLRAVYRACLAREPDPTGVDTFLNALHTGTMDWGGVISAVLNSEEFHRLQEAARSRMPGEEIRHASLMSLHEARTIIFRFYVPPAEVVLDLGGASSHEPEGALFALGYPHCPKELIIVDLPPQDRLPGVPIAEKEQALRAARGTQIRYVYGPMTDLSFVPDATVDLVISGESIEHISEPETNQVCAHAFRVLKPGGHFCLDTPNARLTRLQSPTALIHPEHKKEYCVSELRDKLLRHGFEIVNSLAISPMPGSIAAGVFDYREMIASAGVSDDVESGYCFYLDAIKPPPKC